VLIIAGSDSGGAAGVQADIKTVMALGGFAMTAITAVTAQNTLAVAAVHEVPRAIVAAQITSVLSDLGADVIKTGMMSSIDVIEGAHEGLAAAEARQPRVVDPVMVASSGVRLLKDDAIEALMRLFIRGAEIITPNLPEAEVLTGRSIKTLAEMDAAVPAVRRLGARAVLLKGGHVEGNLIRDLLVEADSVTAFEDTRIDTKATHGTGCTTASAVAVGLAQGLPLARAVARARAYVRQAILTAPGFGEGHGPLNHAHNVAPFQDTDPH
jgi:hydroxymethylpyrimidine/phosphomethylpyrimidine kinase